MSMKIVIFVDLETGEIFYYIPDEKGEAVLVEPRIKKKEWKSKKENESTH